MIAATKLIAMRTLLEKKGKKKRNKLGKEKKEKKSGRKSKQIFSAGAN